MPVRAHDRTVDTPGPPGPQPALKTKYYKALGAVHQNFGHSAVPQLLTRPRVSADLPAVMATDADRLPMQIGLGLSDRCAAGQGAR
jgi:hypothetical protein